jgi:hypothetical protein
MPLFRIHRGQLSDSLKTTVIVKNKEDLKKAILKEWETWKNAIRKDGSPISDFDIKIEPYIGNLDERCGWYTQIVSCNFERKDRFDAVGFLSEPME